MLIDTHCHLHFEDYAGDRSQVIQRAREAGVGAMITIGTDTENNESAYHVANQEENIFHSAGFHPHHLIDEDIPSFFESFEIFLKEKRPVAIGEIGLDYYKSQSDPVIQKHTFSRLLDKAIQHNLPVVIHSREAYEDTMEIIESKAKGKIRGVMHCFSYDKTSLKRVIETGLHISYTCNLTYKKSHSLIESLKHTPLDRLMLETDAPYLSPQIYRGRRNEPAYLKELAQFVSDQLGIGLEAVEKITTHNAVKLFGLDLK